MYKEKAILLTVSLLALLYTGNCYKNVFLLKPYCGSTFKVMSQMCFPFNEMQHAEGNEIKIVGKGFYKELDGATVSFNVNASQDKQRNVNGYMTFKSSFLEFKGSVDCLNLVGGKLIISGTMRQISKGSLDWVFVGIRYQFTFEDNGYRNGTSADRMSGISIGGPSDCVTAINLATPNEIKGDVQISQ